MKKMQENGYLVFSSDSLRQELYGDENIQGNASEILERSKKAINEGKSYVVDATNLNRKRRKNFLLNFEHLCCYKRCRAFVVPVEECLRRNQQRKRKVENEIIREKIKTFQCPDLYEGWDIIEIGHDENWNYQYPFEVIENFSQDNIHHKLSLGNHIKKSEEYCKEHGFSQLVLLAARYHDCGKLYTKIFYK